MRSDAQDNSRLHAYSIAGMVTLVAAMVGGGWAAGDAFAGISRPRGPDLSKLEAIEASVAYRTEPKDKKLVDKKKKAPDPVVKPDGVSHDADKKPIDKPKEDDKPKTKPDEVDPLAKYKRENTDEDLEVGKVKDPTGDFNDKRFGWAPETKGEPYVQDLLLDLIEAGGSYPALAATGTYPVGCFHMNAEGKILDTVIREHSDAAELEDFAERALNGLKKKRNKDPVPIPLDNPKLRPLMTEWTCFRFNLDG